MEKGPLWQFGKIGSYEFAMHTCVYAKRTKVRLSTLSVRGWHVNPNFRALDHI